MQLNDNRTGLEDSSDWKDRSNAWINEQMEKGFPDSRPVKTKKQRKPSNDAGGV